MRFFVFCFFLLRFLFVQAQAPVDTVHEAVPLKPTIVSGTRFRQSIKSAAQMVSVINRQQIERQNAQSTADLLQQSGQVFIQKSQQGGGSPVLRGFEASRVLIVIDKVRLNNAIYRSGHLQNVITMDNAALESAEVLFGPASTVYGTDALGGAVCFFTKNPAFSDGDFKGQANTYVRYGTVNNEKSAHLDFNLSGSRLAALTSLTYSQFGDLKMGKNNGFGPFFGLRPFYADRINGKDTIVSNPDPYRQRESGYSQYDLLQKLSFAPNTHDFHQLNIQYSSSSNIPRYDRLTELKSDRTLRFAEWYYGPQNRLLTAYTFRTQRDFGKWETIVSFQDVEESRHNRNFGSKWLRNRIENVKVYGITSELQEQRGPNTLRYGLDIQHNTVQSTAFSQDILTNGTEPLDTRYPDGSNMTTMALFGTHNWSSDQSKWQFSEGVRLGYARIYAPFKDKTFFPFPFDETRQSSPVYSGSTSAIYTPNEAWRWAINAATGFRVPNIDDLGRVFESVSGQTLIVPNPDLKPEQTFNIDLSLTRTIASVLRWENVAWTTWMRDAIVLTPSTFNGSPTINYGDVEVNVLANTNNRKARLWGLSSHLAADVYKYLAVYGAINYTKGTIQQPDQDTPLDHIPPVYGNIGIRYHTQRVVLEGFMLFSGAKPIDQYAINGEDNAQYAPEGGSVRWQTINLRGSYTFRSKYVVQTGIDNLMDTQYRAFASGINGPGRNIFITLRVTGLGFLNN